MSLALTSFLVISALFIQLACTQAILQPERALLEVLDLSPDTELAAVRIACPSTSPARFRVFPSQLSADTPYEVRISYEAATPAAFKLAWEAGDADNMGRTSQRQLLNTERLHFRTAASEPVTVPEAFLHDEGAPEESYYVLSVSCAGEGVRPHSSMERVDVPFNVVLSTLVELMPGVAIPMESFSVVAVIVIGLAFVFTVAVPQLLPLFQGQRKHLAQKRA